MPLPTGIWTPEEAETGHVFDYKLAQWMGQYFKKNEPLIDLGCGLGTYLRYFHDIGFTDLQGVEGTNMNFEFGNIKIEDLTGNVKLRKGNVICLEVAEHIPEEFMEDLLYNVTETLADEGTLVLSWAIPGQDGLGHVNCRHNIWVIEYLKNNYDLELQVEDSLKARAHVSNQCAWFRDTLMIFKPER